MSPARYASLIYNLDEIQKAYDHVNGPTAVNGENRVVHIGGPLYASMTAEYKCVNLRNYFCTPTGQVVPTHWGVALTIPMWLELKRAGPELRESDPILKTAAACYGLFHDNQLGYYECGECYPYPATTVSGETKAEEGLSTASTLEIAPAAMEVAATVLETTSGSVMAK